MKQINKKHSIIYLMSHLLPTFRLKVNYFIIFHIKIIIHLYYII